MNNTRTVLKRVQRRYSPQFKDQVLERVAKEGVPPVAKELGLTESLLYSWRTQKERGGDTLENQKLQQAELSRLKRENARLAEENAFLKKAAASSIGHCNNLSLNKKDKEFSDEFEVFWFFNRTTNRNLVEVETGRLS